MNENCPFCGKDVAAIDTLNYAGGKVAKYRVQCQECKVATAWYDTADEAWAAWNTRCKVSKPEQSVAGKPKGRPKKK